jgi:hypothetical protein
MCPAADPALPILEFQKISSNIVEFRFNFLYVNCYQPFLTNPCTQRLTIVNTFESFAIDITPPKHVIAIISNKDLPWFTDEYQIPVQK